MVEARESWASSERTRASMVSNRSRDTRPELALRSAIHRLGLRYRVNIRPIKNLRRTADVVFPRLQVAVFVDGCFWHGCKEHYSLSKTNTDFWAAKLAANLRRDEEANDALNRAGWLVVRVWEHEDPARAASRIFEAIVDRRQERLWARPR